MDAGLFGLKGGLSLCRWRMSIFGCFIVLAVWLVVS